PIALSHRYVAADTTMAADGRRHAQIQLARVMAAQRAIGKHTGGADLHQIACELAFEHSIFVAPKENAIGYAEGIQIVASSIVPIKSDATVTLNAAVHLVINKRTEVLVVKGTLWKSGAAIVMTGHHRHVL